MRHYHLSRESIAQAALAIVDQEGLEALNLRSLAKTLGVGASTLYRHVSGRDDILTDITCLLVGEIDTADRPGEPWDETIRRVMYSVHRMALRHPLAFDLVALAPEDRGPLLEHMRRLEQLLAARGLPTTLFPEVWNVIDPFVTGFTLLETKAIRLPQSTEVNNSETASSTDRCLSEAQFTEAFGRALEVVIAGLHQTYVAHSPSSGCDTRIVKDQSARRWVPCGERSHLPELVLHDQGRQDKEVRDDGRQREE